MASSNNNASDGNLTNSSNRAIVLKWMMPRAGFTWPDHANVTKRMDLDQKIQNAMRDHGGTGFRFQRGPVVDLLIEALEAVTAALMCNDPSMSDKFIVMANAIGLAQAQIAWLEALSIEVVQELIFAMLRARKDYVLAVSDEDLERDEETHDGTNAQKLWDAVDKFNDQFCNVARRYNWLEEDNAQHMATVASAMSLGDDQSAEDRAAYAAEARSQLAAMEANKQEKREKARQKAITDENTAPAQAVSNPCAVLTTESFYMLDEDSFGAGYDDSIDPWEADGHPPQKGMEPAGEEEGLEMQDEWPGMDEEWPEMEQEWSEMEEDAPEGEDMDMDTAMDMDEE